LPELLVVVGIGVVLLSVFVPYALAWRESNRRFVCADNLRAIHRAMLAYAYTAGVGPGGERAFPRVRWDENAVGNPKVFTGPDAADPFAADSKVEPNDVTASLWLLVREGILKDTVVFLCPSGGGRRDLLVDAGGKSVDAKTRGNFRGPQQLGYGYADPFGPGEYKLTDTLPGGFVLMADAGPATPPGRGDDALTVSRGNSPNHGRAGQNVLYADGSVQWVSHPFAGVRKPGAGDREGDAIYSSVIPTTGPSYAYDSVLLPNKD
jgi:prepilin-type processing-associated H-X9-DG protein